MACRAWEVCLHPMTKKTGGEKTHRRLPIRYTELILEILSVSQSERTWACGINPAICPTGRFVGDTTVIRNISHRKAYVPGIIPPAQYHIRNRIVFHRGDISP